MGRRSVLVWLGMGYHPLGTCAWVHAIPIKYVVFTISYNQRLEDWRHQYSYARSDSELIEILTAETRHSLNTAMNTVGSASLVFPSLALRWLTECADSQSNRCSPILLCQQILFSASTAGQTHRSNLFSPRILLAETSKPRRQVEQSAGISRGGSRADLPR